MRTLGAVMFIYNGEKFDYCYREAIENMKSFADQVVILAIESEDGSHVVCKTFEDYKCKVVVYPEVAWHSQHGREKLAYFQNEAKKYLETDMWCLIQADEILHERSFQLLRDAVNSGLPAFMMKRYNLWFDGAHMLNVPHERKPCSTEVIRLADIRFDSINDGESFDCPNVCFDLLNELEIFHVGFIRKPAIMKIKVRHMLLDVFQTSYDTKLDKSDVFDPFEYFTREDVCPINGPLPRFIQKWVDERYPNGPIV